MTRRGRGDAGQVAGIEAVPFGLLVVLVGVLVIAHTWAVVDAKFTASRAARAATRAHVEAVSEPTRAADRAARSVVAGAGRGGLVVAVVGPAGAPRRCADAAYRVDLRIPAVGLPWRPDRPALVVSGHHREVVDPYRDGLPGVADCG